MMRGAAPLAMVVAMALTGCAAPQASKPPSSAPATQPSGPTITAIKVDLFQLSVPWGTVSRNERFWKRFDEQCVDIRTSDLLFKNGVRVGVAPIAEWEYFRRVMEQYPAVTTGNTLISFEGRTVELPVRKGVIAQDIFYYDTSNVMCGRSYDASENLLVMTLQSAPRRPDVVRLALCPVVRATRKKLTYTQMEHEQEITYTTPERLYDLNLLVDVPVNSFLVVAPSEEAARTTSVGNRFLVQDGAAERLETVLLLVPRAVQMQYGLPRAAVNATGPTDRPDAPPR